jgi:hypothetical protein
VGREEGVACNQPEESAMNRLPWQERDHAWVLLCVREGLRQDGDDASGAVVYAILRREEERRGWHYTGEEDVPF